MKALEFGLELLNGTAVILGSFLLIWLTFYLYERYQHNQLTFVSMFLGVGGSMSLALYMYVEQLGIIMTRAIVWDWRVHGAIYPFGDIQNLIFSIGMSFISLGVLMIIRLLSRPRFGEWPWLVAAITTLAYVIVRSAMFILE